MTVGERRKDWSVVGSCIACPLIEENYPLQHPGPVGTDLALVFGSRLLPVRKKDIPLEAQFDIADIDQTVSFEAFLLPL